MMWRYVAGGGSILAVVAAGLILARGDSAPPRGEARLPVLPTRAETTTTALPDSAPEATASTREERRFGRYDKDRDGNVTREEYVAQRRKAYAKLDADGDGRLSFDEWAIKATTRFLGADRDRSGAMTPEEFATTAVSRKPARPCSPRRSNVQADEEG